MSEQTIETTAAGRRKCSMYQHTADHSDDAGSAAYINMLPDLEKAANQA